MVQGSIRPGPGMRINRNMVVVRRRGELTIVNAVRLAPEEESSLESLGTVRHVVRLGYFHGLDDRYYVDRYSAKFWCQASSDLYPEPRPDHALREKAALPIDEAELFVFRKTKYPECALLLAQDGGVLVTCDSVQHWVDWHYCNLPAKIVLKLAGFSLTTLIGPFWRKRMTPEGGSLRSDFERLCELEFEHLIGAHGRLCQGSARENVRSAMLHAFST